MQMLLISKLAGLGILFVLGYIFGRRNLIGDQGVETIAWIVIDVTMPALFFTGVLESGFIIGNKGLILAMLAGILLPCLGLLLSLPLFKILSFKNKEKGAIAFSCCVGNSSFIPLPLCSAPGTLACLAYILGNNIFLFSLGIGLLSGQKVNEKYNIIRIFTHPQALAFALGLALFSLNLEPPEWIMEPLDGLAKATLPLAMLLTGAILARERLQLKGKMGHIASVSLIKLLLLPLCALLILKPFNLALLEGLPHR